MPRYAAKVDANQAQITGELRKLGFHVVHTHVLGGGCPDIIVMGCKFPEEIPYIIWAEIKTYGGELTPDEKRFHEEHGAFPVKVVYCTEDILRAFGHRVST